MAIDLTGVRSPEVSFVDSGIRDVPRSSTTGKAIQLAGSIAGELRTTSLLKTQRKDIEALGVAALALDEGNIDPRTGKVDPSTLPRNVEVDAVNEKLGNLRKAAEQGILTESAVRIIAESALKKSIAAAPGRAQEFRRAAATQLGFDPSGSEFSEVLGRSRSRSLTLAEKQEEQFRFIAENTGKSVDEIRSLAASVQLQQLKAQEVTSRIAAGKGTSGDLVRASEQQSLEVSSAFFTDLISKSENANGIANISQALIDIESNRRADIAQLDSVISSLRSDRGTIISSSDRTANIERINAAWDSIKTLVQDTSLNKTLANRKEAVDNLTSIIGVQALPTLALMKSVGGDAAVNTYLTIMNKAGNNPRLIEKDLQRTGLSSLTTPEVMAQLNGSLQIILSNGQISNEETDSVKPGVLSITAKQLADDPNQSSEIRQKGISTLIQAGQAVASLDSLSKISNSFESSSNTTKNYMKEIIPQQVEGWKRDISILLSGKVYIKKDTMIGFIDEEFVLTERDRDGEITVVTPFISAKDERALKGLTNVVKTLRGDSRWMTHIGSTTTNIDKFIADMLIDLSLKISEERSL